MNFVCILILCAVVQHKLKMSMAALPPRRWRRGSDAGQIFNNAIAAAPVAFLERNIKN
jgi:hypothetical protein